MDVLQATQDKGTGKMNASETSQWHCFARCSHGTLSTGTGLAMLLLALLLTSCSTAAPPSSSTSSKMVSSLAELSPINSRVVTTGCGHASSIPLGTSVSVTIPSHPAESEGSRTRSYWMHVPATYRADKPSAIVLVFHGHGGSAAGMDSSSGFSQLAEQHDFLAVYPQGLPQGDGGVPFWASVGPIDYGIDDVLFVSDILNKLQHDFCIDSHRIYATGFSNGGGMTNFLACRLAGRIAAFAPMSGNFYALPGGCHPGRPVAILDFHGTADPVLPYKGIPVSENDAWPLPSIPQWLHEWAVRNGCTSGPTIFLHQPHVTGEQWSGCQGNAAVVHYRIEGGGHSGPPAIDGHSAASVTWQFFQSHPYV